MNKHKWWTTATVGHRNAHVQIVIHAATERQCHLMSCAHWMFEQGNTKKLYVKNTNVAVHGARLQYICPFVLSSDRELRQALAPVWHDGRLGLLSASARDAVVPPHLRDVGKAGLDI
eukprot:355524-Chlamydomonas_euryale.AAC.16